MADGNTIAEQIADIAASKAAIAAAIAAKGVTVPEGAKLADLAAKVGQISGGAGGAEDTCVLDRDTMTELVIPKGVTQIGNYAFDGCNALTSLIIPDSVTSIGFYAFNYCPSSCNIVFNKTMAEVSGMSNYPWGISSGATVHCTDGDLTVY